MADRITQEEQNLRMLQTLIPRSEKFYIWCYKAEGELIASSCPAEKQDLMNETFEIFGGLGKLLEYAEKKENSTPLIIGSPIGMQWALTYEAERSRRLIFVIGPVFYARLTQQQIYDALHPYIDSQERAAWSKKLLGAVTDLPVMTYAVFSRYVIMIHNMLTGQQLGMEAVTADSERSGVNGFSTAGERDRNRIYLAERAMLDMVRKGDINYQSVLYNSMQLSPGVPIRGRDPLRQNKTSIIVFTSLVCRAAMEGGLSPEIAYALGDSYIQSVEDCRDSGELSELAIAMYHDFICRVHELHAVPGCSHAVQKCCDYIELNLGRKIRASDLASLVGYTEYYLTEKFKKETGMSVSSYIRRARIERAKMLLESTDQSVSEISEQLAFNTVNYFIQSFHDHMGCSPAQYRKDFRKTLRQG